MKKALARLVRVSPAMVVAMLALMVALGGAATAADKISKPEAKAAKTAKTAPPVKRGPRGKRGLRGLRGVPGPRGAQGVPGPAGAQGVQGIQGPPGPDNIRLAAQRDSTVGGTSTTATPTAPVQVNSLTFNAPSAGYVVISGNVFINSTTATVYYLTPQIDGVNVRTFGMLDHTTAGELESMAYTMPAAITAGNHTITQTIRTESGTGSFFYNANDLTVSFIPQGAIAAGTLATTSASASG